MDPAKKDRYFKRVSEKPFARLLNLSLRDVDEGYAL